MYLGYCFPGGAMVKNPPANARDIGDTGLIPGSDLDHEREVNFT